jgi:hypothetical protein
VTSIDETLANIRYANRLQKIKTVPMVNHVKLFQIPDFQTLRPEEIIEADPVLRHLWAQLVSASSRIAVRT